MVVVLLVGALVLDNVAGWFGIGLNVAVGLGTVGLVIWVLQGFKGGAGAMLFFGALFVGVLPMLLPHYLGAGACGA
jgi:hypothetical protein